VSRPLAELIARLDALGLLAARPELQGTLPIGRVVMDSRRVEPGVLFAAVPGQHADGHDHAAEAAAHGAVALLVERPLPAIALPQVVVTAARPALAVAAAWAAGDPATQLGVVGITGTDGKTTTAWLTRSVLEAAGEPTGLIGTIDVIAGGRSAGNAARTTTPEAPELQEHLAAMLAGGDRWAVIEATSHGLAQDRCGAIPWDVVIHTNITSEHLEFHGTLAAYRAAKRRLFEWPGAAGLPTTKRWGRHAIVNRDDGAADELAAAASAAGARVIGYGSDPGCEVVALAIRDLPGGMRVRVRTPRWEDEVEIRLAGRFNVWNALAAISAGEALALDPGAIRRGIAGLRAVPGRMERIDAGQPFGVIVDYAHTAESLATVLDGLAAEAAANGGALIACFGSAGDRDRTKRPVMGAVAARRCRAVVLTDEDARSEDPEAILAEIAAGAESAGMRRGDGLHLVPDRRQAIATAFRIARPGEIVLLAGKGHERSIEVAGERIPWDEAAVAREELAALGWGAGPAR